MSSAEQDASSTTSRWVLPSAIPFEHLKGHDLEECVYWLMDSLGAKDLEWRVGGIVAAAKEVNLSVPLVVRLEGTNVAEGKAILNNSGLAIVNADDLGDAARKIVAEVKKAA